MSAKDTTWFREQLKELGYTQSSFAREISEKGDPRHPEVIRRGVSRMATGVVGISGEMRVIISLMREIRG